MAASDPRPSMEHELQVALSKIPFPQISSVTPSVLKMLSNAAATPSSYVEDLQSRGVSHRELTIPSQDGSGHQIILSVLHRSSKPTSSRPCIYWIHGGGFHWGDRLHLFNFPAEVVLECDAVCFSVEYRLAPEYSFSTAMSDCYTGLVWASQHAEDWGFDPKRLMISGTSAGGGLAAATAIYAREHQGPSICAQCLICPALDDRLTTASSRQYLSASDFIPRQVFEQIWSASAGSSSAIIPPGRVEDLSGLPTTFLDVGSAEVLRDEVVAYATRLWKYGVQAELHVWEGGFHGFDIFAPEAAVSKASRKAKIAWTKRIFGVETW